MAKPIEFVPASHDPRSDLKRRIDDAPSDHAAAVLSAYDLLEELHKSGTLDLLRGAASASGEIVQQASDLASQPESVRALRNLLLLGKLLGNIDPDSLRRLTEHLPTAVAQHPPQNPPSLFRIFRRISSKDSRRALAFFSNALEKLGRGVGPEK